MGTIENLDEFSLFLFTDGLTETFDEAEEEFEVKDLEKYLVNHYGEPLNKLHTGLIKELDQFRAGKSFTDDLTFPILQSQEWCLIRLLLYYKRSCLGAPLCIVN